MSKINQELNRFINQRLDFYLKKNNLIQLSHTKIAEELGIHRGTWVNVRYGKSNLSTDILVEICKRLNAPLSEFFAGYSINKESEDL